MLPTVISLGFWQLRRADEKQVMEEAFTRKLTAPVKPVSSKIDPFDRISLQGVYGAKQFLVDNQVHQGRVGYWIIQTFEAQSGGTFLINRGWVAAPPSRSELPIVPAPSTSVHLLALAWPQTGLLPLVGSDTWDDGVQVRVQRRDIDRMAGIAGAYPVELRLQDGAPGVLTPAPLVIEFGRAVHIGYAVQWFGLATVLIIGYYVVYRKSRSGDSLTKHG
jgi:surfeit locus 1 family protein